MFVLYQFGTTMIHTLGSRGFMGLYILSGMLASASSILFNNSAFSLGASGCISGLAVSYAMIYPYSSIMVLIFPMPAYLAIGGVAAYDLYSLIAKRRTGIDHAGHLGGGVGGLLWTLLKK
ncbi:hypothetical protein HDV06_002218 [Boothiomyces sp. JEL0866]|nr:hypothetical protein HDV06_002218 [Boothiomyces sp. JEL0866]